MLQTKSSAGSPHSVTLSARHITEARNELARRHLPDFACSVDIPTVPVSVDPEDESLGDDRFDEFRNPVLATHHRLLLDKLQGIEDGTIPNLMVFMPPGSAKSTYVDVVFIPWFMAKRPRRHVILASYASNIAAKQGRRARQLIKTPEFGQITGCTLDPDKTAADEWMLSNGSEYMAGGILSGLTGNRAALGVWDDLIRGREAAESETIRDKTWDAYQDDFCSRLIPGAPQIGIMCMTGDTPVLMADGTERSIESIRAGDLIATYEAGRLATSAVRNWANQGPDIVFTIRMKSGRTVRANARHPFLVSENGSEKWRRTDTLKRGNLILTATGEGGGERPARQVDVRSQRVARAFAILTMAKIGGRAAFARRLSIRPAGERQGFAIAMALSLLNMTRFLLRRAGIALSVVNRQPITSAPIGAGSSASITTMRQAQLEGCSATTATLRSDMERQSKSFSARLNTFAVTLDTVESVTPAGIADVYDIQVDRTENFIANGLVSHNTRWHEDDVAGRILPEGWKGESGWIDGRDGRRWYVICLPALADRDDDPLGRQKGETLWPGWFSLEHWKPFQLNARTWSSLYQQKPSPEEGTYFKRPDFQRFTDDQLPSLRYYGTSDYAVTDGGGDYTRLRIWGIDGSVPSRAYLIDGWGGQTGSEQWIEAQVDLMSRYRPAAWYGEGGVIQKAIEPMLVRLMRDRRVSCRTIWLPSIHDKATRARSAQAMVESGRIYVRDDHDGDCFIDECVAFPGGRYDDDVDNLSLIGRASDQLGKPREESRPPAPPSVPTAWMGG